MPRPPSTAPNPAAMLGESSATKLFRWSDRILVTLLIVAALATFWFGLFPKFYYMGFIGVGALSLAIILPALIAGLVVRLVEHSQKRAPTAKRNRELAFALLFFASPWIAAYFQLPMRLGFLTIRPKLEQAMAGLNPSEFAALKSDIASPLYRISAAETNRRLNWGTCNTNRVLFILANDGGSAFIYSPSGIQNLCYNSGSAGHLMGPWYWMTED